MSEPGFIGFVGLMGKVFDIDASCLTVGFNKTGN